MRNRRSGFSVLDSFGGGGGGVGGVEGRVWVCVIAGGCEKIRFTNGVFRRTFHLLSCNVLH